MATKNADLRNALADAFGTKWDNGTLKIYTAGNAQLLATFTFDADSFAASANGVVALNGVPMSVAAAASGTAAVADLASENPGTYTLTGLTVGESAAQIILDNTDINSGQTVTLTSFTWTESASA